jgi:hypothetical protein
MRQMRITSVKTLRPIKPMYVAAIPAPGIYRYAKLENSPRTLRAIDCFSLVYKAEKRP